MPRSPRFRALEKELNILRKYFLPRKFDPSGLYSERQLVHASSYRVLAHAEIEAYLEDRMKEIALSAVKAWKKNAEIRRTLICLLAFSGMELEAPPDSLTPKQTSSKQKHKEKLQLDQKIDKALSCFISCVNDNHGIKEKNLLTLLLPIGINCDYLEEFWLTSMNSFGENRGIIAHTSASSYKTTQPINPKDELDNIKKIVYGEPGVQGLKDIDELLNALMK
ncbi:HEPN domain-containing protein [Gloeothece verrucosa]|uniref:RiboL-PSP-HEPN domain-containing protein n=1 Tax=Gloeothece verrucosa (strain PCC 7822) TaxID=497965 RepID=E0U550_GLOV7|nr:HEPN domain-containing protein [Gloeothece verrucosa]ADN12329.1 hypothetical protein Cyan7822_0283 [Gloeothece verrucosa PCC 7822]